MVPSHNPMSEAKVALGRRLFFDKRLSADQSMACAGCHLPNLAFSDGKAKPKGHTGQEHPRNAQGLANVGFASTLTWANPAMVSLENQALVPLFGEDPVELGLSGREGEAIARIAEVKGYLKAFARAFPEAIATGSPTEAAGAQAEATASPSVGLIAKALAAFQRSLLSFDTPYDRFAQGDAKAMSPIALRGMALFNSEEMECFHCHVGTTFSDSVAFEGQANPEFGFHNTGLYNLDAQGAYPEGGQGLLESSNRPQDMGAFRTPTLRNLSRTAPYFHDGSAKDLPEVLAHYRAGGRTLTGPFAGVGANNPHKSSFVRGFSLSQAEQAELLAFLAALDDPTFGTKPEQQDPWERP